MYFISQQKESNDIWKNHDPVNQIGKAPYHSHRNHCTEIGHEDIAEMVGGNPFSAEKVFCPFFAKVAPSDQSGKGKCHQGNGQQLFPVKGQHGKGGHGKSALAVSRDRGWILKNVGNHQNPGKRTHDNGIPEYCSHGNEPLTARGRRACGSSDRGGSDTGFVGEQPSGDAEAQGTLQCAPCETAEGCSGMKGSVHDQRNRTGDGLSDHPQQDQAAANIEKSQEGHDLHAEITDGADSTDHDESGKYGSEDPGDMRGNTPACTDRIGDGI